MKKVLAFFLCLAAAGGFVWAQDEETAAVKPALKFSGSVKTGINIAIEKGLDDSGEYGAGVKFLSDDVGDDSGNDAGRAWRADLNGVYNADTWGVQFGLRAQKELMNNQNPFLARPETPSVIIREAFGFISLFDKNLTLKAGVIGTKVWNTRGLRDRELSVSPAAGSPGLRIEVTPAAVKGLNFGAAWYGHAGIGGFADYYYGNAVVPGSISEKLGEFVKATTIGVSYDADSFYAAAAFRPEGKSKGKFGGYNGPYSLVKNQFVFGFGLKSVENLTLDIEALYADGFDKVEYYLNGISIKGYSNYKPEINANIAYQIGKLNAGIEVYANPGTPSYKNEDVCDLHLYPYFDYELNDRVKLGLTIGAANLVSKTTDGKSADEKSNLELSVKPGVTCTLGKNTKFTAYDNVSVINPSNSIANAVQLDFVWSF